MLCHTLGSGWTEISDAAIGAQRPFSPQEKDRMRGYGNAGLSFLTPPDPLRKGEGVNGTAVYKL
jgi:hypothetical protein